MMVARTKFTSDDILLAALAEIRASGLDGASVAAIGRRLGAPSGSIYHRFPSRQHLLGALWVSIATSYREALLAALAPVEPHRLPRSIVDHTFDWVEANPGPAELLMRLRTEDFTPGDWPDEIIEQIRAVNASLLDAVGGLAARLGTNPLDTILAVIDIPAAAARRSLLINSPEATAHLRQRTVELVTKTLALPAPVTPRRATTRTRLG